MLIRSFILWCSLGGAGICLLCGSITLGQDALPASDAVGETERVIVIGSNIPTAETESALPVVILTGERLQKQGANTPAEGLRQLPSFVGNTATENDSNGGNGEARINLRALGDGNTLTLINGRRALGFENINAIPIGAVARSEVLKDGASAIYGSDAVAGVVNFILTNGPGETPLDGAEVYLLYGNTSDSDSRVLQGYVRGGVTSTKLAVAVVAEYYDRASLYARDREISKLADVRKLGGRNGGSTLFPGVVTVTDPDGEKQLLVLSDLSNNAPTPASYRPFDEEGPGTDPSRFNYRAFSPAIPGQEKYNYFATANYKVFGDALQIYGDLLYARTKQDNGLAPSPFFIPLVRYQNASLGIFNGRDANGRLNGSLDNSIKAQLGIIRKSPFNPFGKDLNELRYRFVQELGNRRDFFDADYHRYVAGVKGDLSFPGNTFLSHLGYDAGAVYEGVDHLETDRGDATRGGIYREILAGNFNPFIGLNAPVAGTVPTYRNGVPTGTTASYDNFAAAQRAAYVGHSYRYSRDFLVDGKVNGNLFPALYQGGVAFNIGGEYRQSRSENTPDPVFVAGDELGFSQAFPSKYKQEVRSAFGEVTIPLVISTLNIPAVRSLEISVAVRYEEFENSDELFQQSARFDNGGTPRLSLRYQPIADLTLRASYGKSFLSPSPEDLFFRETLEFFDISDPLINDTAQPINGASISGNPKLTPEKTETYTAGFAWTPKFIPGFTTTVDFYQIYTTDMILDPFSFIQIAVTANGNAGGGPGAPFAEFIQRADGPGGAQTGEIISVDAQNQNASKRLVSGMDITATYRRPTQHWGAFTLSLGYNYFFTWKAEPFAGAGTTNFLGDYNNGSVPLAPGAIPYHKGFLRGEWEWKGFDFNSTLNYIGSFNDDSSFLLGVEPAGGTDTNPQFDVHRKVPAYVTLDMQLSYEFKKGATVSPGSSPTTSSFLGRVLAGTKITVGVNDILNEDPPTVLGAFNDSYDTSLYSLRNRFYYVSLNKKF